MLDTLPKTRAVLERGRADGLHHGAQLFVSLKGGTVCDAAVGEVRPGEPLTADHLMLWLSAGKPVTAAAVLHQCQLFTHFGPGLRLDAPVAESLPDFAARGKGGVTVRHLLTHMGGFPDAETGYPDVDWDESLRRICDAPLAANWKVGRTAGYHPKSSWFVLGELLRRRAGGGAASFDSLMRRSVFTPCGMTRSHFAFTPDTLEARRQSLAPLYQRKGRELIDAGRTEPAYLSRASPGSSLRCPARDLGAFHERLLRTFSAGFAEEEGGPVHSALQVEAMTARHRVGEFDRTLGHVVDFGLGVIVDSNRYGPDTVPYGFGPHCSPRTFGHGGNQSSMAFCDPENELVVAWATNGMCGEPKHQRRNRAINAAIYEDLGLAG